MIYKTYGQTGHQVSAIGFGGMRFDMDQPLEANAELVRYAAERGINYFDTAPGYCGGKSEAIFGMALRDLDKPFYVSTKAMPEHYNTVDKAVDRVKESLDNLQVDAIDFYHVWCLRKMEHYDIAMAPGAQYDGLLKAKEQGLIKHIVFSSHQPGHEIKTILDDGKFEGVLLGMNLLNFPYRWDGARAAYDKGYGVVAMNPLAGGMIPTHEKELAFLAEEGETATEAALRFAVSCPQITVALNGFTTREHIDTACRVADRAQPFTDTQLDALRKKLGENLDAICTGCGYCNGCPAGINIAGYMQVYNERQMFNKSDDEMRQTLSNQFKWGILVGQDDKWRQCIECRQCEEVCTQHLPIIERLKAFAKWAE